MNRLNIVMLSFICKYRPTVDKRTFIFSCKTVFITIMAFLMSYRCTDDFLTVQPMKAYCASKSRTWYTIFYLLTQ